MVKQIKPVNINKIGSYQKGVPVRLAFNQIGVIEDSHFLSTEFDCKCKRPECQTTLIDETLVMKLEWIRRQQGVIKINCGYRCKAHNEEVKGSATNSQHCLGLAADIVLSKRPPRQVQLLLSDPMVSESVGLSVGKYDTFTHVDTRPFPVIFDKRTIKGVALLEAEKAAKLAKKK